LKTVLERRGVHLSATALATALAASESVASVPALLLHSTARAALEYAAGVAPATLVSARAIGLLETITRPLTVSKLKIVTALLFAIGISAGSVGVFSQLLSAAQTSDPPAAPSAEPSANAVQQANAKKDNKPAQLPDHRDESGQMVEVKGRVLDPDGLPLAGAKIYCCFYGQFTSPPERIRTAPAASAADGSFLMRVPRSDFSKLEANTSWSQAIVAAAAPGYGPGWVDFARPEQAGALTIRLVKDDVPIEGRLVGLEGRPIQGVTVTIGALEAATDEDLTAWLSTAQSKPDQRWLLLKRTLYASVPVLPQYQVTTGPDGRFRFAGVGRERIVTLSLQGPTIEAHQQDVHVLSRAVKSFHLPMNTKVPDIGNIFFYGTGSDIAVAPTKPIVGTVRDQDTGKALAGVSIQSVQLAGRGLLLMDFLRTTSDRDGHYRLPGMPKGTGNVIVAVPAVREPYFASQKEVGDSPGMDPVQVDFGLKRGVPIRGRITDKRTGKPVRADVRYAVFLDNPQLNSASGYSEEHPSVKTDADGSFLVFGLPGRGVLGIKADEDRFLANQGIDQIPPANKEVTNIAFVHSSPRLMLDEYHAFVQVNPTGKGATCDVALDPGRAVSGTVVGPGGQALDGVQMIDLS